MNIQVLKNKISRKFGSMSKFASAAKMTPYELQLLFIEAEQHEDTVSEIDAMIGRLKASQYGGDIPPKKLSALKIKIKSFGGVRLFCTDNPQFNDRTLFQVLQGRRKRMSPIVVELFNHFKI